MPRFTRRRFAAVAIGFSAFLAACGGIANPEGWSTPHFNDDALYYFPEDDLLVSLPLDGDGFGPRAWTFPGANLADDSDIDLEAVYGDLVVTDGIIYFAGWEGDAYALNADDGSLVWTTRDRVSITGSIVGGLAHQDDRIFFATTEGYLYALDAETGTAATGWPIEGIEFPKGIWSTPVIVNGTLYVATMTGEVHALSVENGEPVWDEPFESGTGAIPELTLLDDGTLFVPTLGKRIYLLDSSTGQELQEPFQTGDWVWTTPAYHEGFAYFGDFEGDVHALDITTGQDRWTFETGNKIKAGPALVGNTLVVADRGPTVHFIDITTGERRGIPVPLPNAGTVRADLVAYEGAAYILSTNGKLFRADPEGLTVVEVAVPGASN